MKEQRPQVFIVEKDRKDASALRIFLKRKFGRKIDISLYFNARSCLRMMHPGVNMVVVDPELGKDPTGLTKGVDLVRELKDRYPDTEIIAMTSHTDIESALRTLKAGASDFIPKDDRTGQRLLRFIDQSIQQPIRAWTSMVGVDDYVVIFFLTWIVIGAVVGGVFLIMRHTA